MTRQRMFIPGTSVLDAARIRMRNIYDQFDTVAVQVSGGKDSTAVLLLAREIQEERGLGPVKVIFRDEEMVSPTVVTYMEWLREQPWVEMEWYVLPIGQEIWVLGRREYVLLWSQKRAQEGRLVRDIPPWAITAESFGLDPGKPIPQSIDVYTMQGKEGKVAFVTGVRANESMVRYRSLVQKLHENYIVRPYKLSKKIPLWFAKPIYDWTTDDVFKYITEQDFPYCEYYDLATLTGSNTRVGIPLHSVAIRRIGDVVATEPEFYDRLVDVFPQIDAQRRWWKEFDIEGLIEDYAAEGWDGVRRCIEENMLTPGIQQRANAFAAESRRKHNLDPHAYPIAACVRTLLLNEFSTTAATPVGPKTRADTVRVAAAQALEVAQ
jgi:predicted phosphoadenosine phosphosulfate sulfurtransferase